jgi:hypothetical protein
MFKEILPRDCGEHVLGSPLATGVHIIVPAVNQPRSLLLT